jgi:hypothetical protein
MKQMFFLLLLLSLLLVQLVSCATTSSSTLGKDGVSNTKLDQFHGLATLLESDIPSCADGQIRRFLLNEEEARGKVNSCTYFFTMLVDERMWQNYFEGVNQAGISALFGSYGCQELGNTATSWECIEARRGQAKQIKSILKELEAISQLCLTETLEIGETVSLQLRDTGMTEQIVTEDFDGATVKELDFPFNAIYESACMDASGNYVELSYRAICYEYFIHKEHEYLDLKVSEYVRMERLTVDNHQICFATSCTRIDRNGLVQEFAMKPTEALNKRYESLEGVATNGTFHMFCLGEESETSAPSNEDLCLSDTLTMAKVPELEVTERAVRLKVGYEKFMGFIIIKREKIVTFPGLHNEVQAYKAVCQSSGGFYNELGDTDILCSKLEREATAGNVYKVEDFGACLADSCDRDAENTDAAMAAMFRKRLIESGNLENVEEMECVISGAFRAISMAAVITLIALVPALEQCL